MAQAAPAARAPKVDAQRRGLYATIAIACKELSIDDQSRRDMIAAQCGGKTSMKACSIAELEGLVDHLKRQGFKSKNRGGRAPNRTGPARAGDRALADAPEARKARALWLSLYHLGVVRSPQESALAKFGDRAQHRVDRAGARVDGHQHDVRVLGRVLARGRRLADAGPAADDGDVRHDLGEAQDVGEGGRALGLDELRRCGDPHAGALVLLTALQPENDLAGDLVVVALIGPGQPAGERAVGDPALVGQRLLAFALDLHNLSGARPQIGLLGRGKGPGFNVGDHVKQPP